MECITTYNFNNTHSSRLHLHIITVLPTRAHIHTNIHKYARTHSHIQSTNQFECSCGFTVWLCVSLYQIYEFCLYGCNFLFQCSHIELWINVIIVVNNLFGIYLIFHGAKANANCMQL